MKKQHLNSIKNFFQKICTGTLTVILLSGCCFSAVSASEQNIPDTEQETQQSEQQQGALISEEGPETESTASKEDMAEDTSKNEENSVSETVSDEENKQNEDTDEEQSGGAAEEQDENEYKMPELLTSNAEYVLGSGTSLTLQLLLNGFTVTGIRANGNAVNGKYMTLSAEGSVTISAEYLEKLKTGTTVFAVDLVCENRTCSLTCTLTVTEPEAYDTVKSSDSIDGTDTAASGAEIIADTGTEAAADTSENSEESSDRNSSCKDHKKENTDSSESDTAADNYTGSTDITKISETTESVSSGSAGEKSEKAKSGKSNSGSTKTNSKGNSSGGKKKSSKSDTASQEEGQAWLESCSGEYVVYYLSLTNPGNPSDINTDYTLETARLVIDQDTAAGYTADGTELFRETYVYSDTEENTGAPLFLSENEGPFHCLVLSGEAGRCLFFRYGASADEINTTYSTSSQITCGLLLDSALTEEERENKTAEVFHTLVESLSGQSAGTSR